MHGLDPWIKEQIGYHIEGDLAKAMELAKKSNMWRSKGQKEKKGENKQKSGT